MEFDEQQAIKYMLSHADISRQYDDDQILNLIDIIWDYYEDKGLLDISLEDDSEVDKDDLICHTIKLLAKDTGNEIIMEDIPALVGAELEYESTLDVF